MRELALVLIMGVLFLVTGCGGSSDPTGPEVHITGNGNVTTVGTTGAGVATAPCANASGGVKSANQNTPTQDCSTGHNVESAPAPEAQ